MNNALLMIPTRFDATSYIIRSTVNSVTEDLRFPPSPANLTVGRNYWPSGDGQADADGGVGGVGDLFALLDATLESHGQPQTFTAVLTAAFRTQIDISASTFQLLFSHANTTFDESIFGFANFSLPLSPAATLTSGWQPKGIWRPNKPLDGEDSRDRSPFVGAHAAALSGLQRSSDLITTPKKEREIGFRQMTKDRVLEEFAIAAEPFGAFDTIFASGIKQGWAFRVYEDETVINSGSYRLYKIRADGATARDADPIKRNGKAKLLFDVELEIARVT